MQPHHRALLLQKLDSYLKRKIIFAELDTRGKILQCPRCQVPFTPHLGNWITRNFECESCKTKLYFQNSTGNTTPCACCRMSRPLQNNLAMLKCARCEADVIHQKDYRAVKCFDCKHMNIPNFENYGVGPVNQDLYPSVQIVPPQVNQEIPPAIQVVFSQANPDVPPEVNRVVFPEVNRVIPRQGNRILMSQVSQDVPPQNNPVVFPQGNRVVPPQVNRAVPPQVNRAVPPQVNRVVPPPPARVYNRRNRAPTAETESSASSSVTVRNDANKRDVEEDKTDEAGASKRIRF